MLLRIVQSQSMRFADGVIFLTEYAAKVIQADHGQAASDHRDTARRRQRVQGTKRAGGVAARRAQADPLRLRLQRLHVQASVGRREGDRAPPQPRPQHRAHTRRRRLGTSTASPRERDRAHRYPADVRQMPGISCSTTISRACSPMPIYSSSRPVARICPTRSSRRWLLDCRLRAPTEGRCRRYCGTAACISTRRISRRLQTRSRRSSRNAELRVSLADRAKRLSTQYSWSRCADETWTFLKTISGLS